MRLSGFRVEGLFGLFNHDVPLNLDERITILHSPNGYGKTILLKMVAAFFGGSLSLFREVEFAEVVFSFEGGGQVVISQDELQPDMFPDQRPREKRSYRILYRDAFGDQQEWRPDDPRGSEDWREIPPSMWERWLAPQLQRVGSRVWLNPLTGERYGPEEVAERYWHLIPPSVRRRHGRLPEWLDTLRAEMNCRLIETQRLFILKRDAATSSEPALTPTVRTYSAELAASIERLLAESARVSQALDQTFPNRILQSMHQRAEPLTEMELRQRLGELEGKRRRLANVGLLDPAAENPLEAQDRLDDPTRHVLTAYVEDTHTKLGIYDEMLEKVELFLKILNSRFQFKSISVSRGSGFVFHDVRQREISAEALSSGEQHELILLYELLFKSQRNTLFLLDEPEISLHIVWQKRFLSDLRSIIALTGIDTVLATHSPQLIGGDLHLMVQLNPPADDLLNR